MEPAMELSVRDLRESTRDEANSTTVRLPGFLDYMLIVLTDGQRVPLLVALATVVLLSVVGNVATIVVNVRRQMRAFFRTCLLSLACGDLISTICQSASYAAQLSSIHPPVWTLGAFMCGAAPFLSTVAVLVNSFVLVAIALDRYVAVGKLWSMREWEPSIAMSAGFAVATWTLAAAVGAPMVMRYDLVDVFIIETNPANRTQMIDVRPAQMCVSDRSPNFTYYSILFGVIYVPLVCAFVWLNGVIAVEIWRRRKSIRSMGGGDGSRASIVAAPCCAAVYVLGTDEDQSTGKRTMETGTNSAETCDTAAPTVHQVAYPTATNLRKRSSREIRQLRMFRAILIIMGTFLICRLPSWIYLLYKLQNTANTPGHWVLQYALGILSLVSCVVNPLLYTFLAETIDVSFALWDRLRTTLRCRCGGDSGDRLHSAPTAATSIKPMQFYCSEDRKEKQARVD